MIQSTILYLNEFYDIVYNLYPNFDLSFGTELLLINKKSRSLQTTFFVYNSQTVSADFVFIECFAVNKKKNYRVISERTYVDFIAYIYGDNIYVINHKILRLKLVKQKEKLPFQYTYLRGDISSHYGFYLPIALVNKYFYRVSLTECKKKYYNFFSEIYIKNEH